MMHILKQLTNVFGLVLLEQLPIKDKASALLLEHMVKHKGSGHIEQVIKINFVHMVEVIDFGFVHIMQVVQSMGFHIAVFIIKFTKNLVIDTEQIIGCQTTIFSHSIITVIHFLRWEIIIAELIKAIDHIDSTSKQLGFRFGPRTSLWLYQLQHQFIDSFTKIIMRS